MCSRCQHVAYCCPEHQKQDWSSHKSNCSQQFSAYTTPKTSSDVISKLQMIEVINGPIQGDFYVRDRDNITGTYFHYGSETKKFIILKDIVFLPLSQPEIEVNIKLSSPEGQVAIYLKDSIVKVKNKNVYALDLTVVYKKCISYQFLSFTMDQIQILQAALDYIFTQNEVPNKSQIILFSNSEVVSSIFGTLLLGQVWRTYNLKPFEIRAVDVDTIPKPNDVVRNLVTYKL